MNFGWKDINIVEIIWMGKGRSAEHLNKLYKPPAQQDNSGNYSKLKIVIMMSVLFIGGQMFGGYISHSISVFSDAIHLITDLIGFILSFVSIYYSRKKSNHHMSFGYHRFELLGAIANLFIIWALALFLIYEATNHILQKVYVRQPRVMMIVAVAGLPVNIIMYFILHTGAHSHGLMADDCGGVDDEDAYTSMCVDIICQDTECLKKLSYQEHCHVTKDGTDKIHKHEGAVKNEEQMEEKEGQKPLMDESQTHAHSHHSHQNMSMKAAVLHALTDIIQSIGLIISSLCIFFFGSDRGAEVTEWNDWHYFDPVSTYVFSLIVIASTWPVAKNCYHIMMESTPHGVSIPQVYAEFEGIRGVMEVHDLHMWELRPGKAILIAHVVAHTGTEREVLMEITDWCRRKKIYHSTIQVQEREWTNHKEYIRCHHDIH